MYNSNKMVTLIKGTSVSIPSGSEEEAEEKQDSEKPLLEL